MDGRGCVPVKLHLQTEGLWAEFPDPNSRVIRPTSGIFFAKDHFVSQMLLPLPQAHPSLTYRPVCTHSGSHSAWSQCRRDPGFSVRSSLSVSPSKCPEKLNLVLETSSGECRGLLGLGGDDYILVLPLESRTH